MKNFTLLLFLLSVTSSVFAQNITVTSTEATGANTGTIKATLDPPLDFAPYTLIWTDKDENIVANCEFTQFDIDNGIPPFFCEATGLNPGTYCLEATAIACDMMAPATIIQCYSVTGRNCDEEINLIPSPTDPIQAICSNEVTGNIPMVFLDTDDCYRDDFGDLIFDYEWSDGQTTASPIGLSPGEYCVTLTPSSQAVCADCYYVNCIEVPALDEEPLNISAWTGDICYTIVTVDKPPFPYSYIVRSNGWIILRLDGGYGPYEINWLDGNPSGTYRSISSPGTYCVEISDACGNVDYECWDIERITTDQFCLSPAILTDVNRVSFESDVADIVNAWENLPERVPLDENWTYVLKESSELSAYYSLLGQEDNQEYGSLQIDTKEADRDRSSQPDLDDESSKTTLINVVKVYPNPAKDFINMELQSDQSKDAMLRFYSMTGSLIYSEQVFIDAGENTYTINTNNLPSGVYFLKIENENPIKVIITK